MQLPFNTVDGKSGEIVDDFLNAIIAGDIAAIYRLAEAGQDLNALDEFSRSPLQVAIYSVENVDRRRLVVETLLILGSKPTPNPEGDGPLFSAIVQADYVVLALLLAYGADPSEEHDMGESLYEWSEFDYRYEVWDLDLPERPTDADRVSEAAWLEFLDRLAIKFVKLRPVGLRMLLEHLPRQ